MVSDLALWVLGAALTINITILTVLGKFIKETYDIATDLNVLLNGTNPEQEGFVERTEKSQRQLSNQQEDIERHIEAQGALTEEMAYAMADLAQAVDEMNGHDIDVDRIHNLRERWDDERYRDTRRDGGGSGDD